MLCLRKTLPGSFFHGLQPVYFKRNTFRHVSNTLLFLGQRGLSAKTPRKALGDLGNIQNGTGKKNFQTPKPSKLKIFDENQKPKSSVKLKKGTFSVLNTHKKHNKTSSDAKIKTNHENLLPEIGKMIPFVDEGAWSHNCPSFLRYLDAVIYKL